MTPEEKKRLKKEGKRKVEHESAALHKRLKESNPFDIGDPRWVEAYKEEVNNSIEVRQNISKVYSSEEVAQFASIRESGISLENGKMMPHRNIYIQCGICGDFVPTNARKDVSCSCKSTSVSFVMRQYHVPQDGNYKLVTLSGKNTKFKKRKWWQIWK